ncbi:SDR family NAD(P)-dependent oxidoreductase [Arthrobacter sp. GCM10027362]|uniref:SDR family NAD(P)-dependent oxidoreductase n=1 Tax=Arthrobacter sp. GCM10027362 TaxID=3273379 RepID=UPI003640E208
MTNELLHRGLPRRIVVTGGSSGIGFAVARFFLESGARVGIIGRDAARLEAAAEELRRTTAGNVRTACADVRDEEKIGPAIGELAGSMGGIDALVAAAGAEGEMGAACEDITAASFRDVLDINVTGTFLAVQAALPHLKRARDASIVIIGSDSGFVAVPGMLAYNASKGALVQLTRALAVELFDAHGIRVNSVCPSIVDTPMARRGLGVESFADAAYPVQESDDIAWSVGYLASRRSRAVNGVNLLSDFGYTGRSSFPA